MGEKLRETEEEKRIVRLRIKIQHEENKEEMDFQEKFLHVLCTLLSPRLLFFFFGCCCHQKVSGRCLLQIDLLTVSTALQSSKSRMLMSSSAAEATQRRTVDVAMELGTKGAHHSTHRGFRSSCPAGTMQMSFW